MKLLRKEIMQNAAEQTLYYAVTIVGTLVVLELVDRVGKKVRLPRKFARKSI